MYYSCKQILLIYPTDLFKSVIELTITQHSVWQYRIVRRSDLLQDQFNNSAWNTCMYTELCRQKTQVLELIIISTCISATLRDTHCQFSENICSDDDLRSEIFGTFAVKFLACLPLLGYWTSKKWYNWPFSTAFFPKKVTCNNCRETFFALKFSKR